MRTAVLSSDAPAPCVAFSVGRAVGNAAQRNQVRRRLRAALREHSLLLAPGSGYLVYAAPAAAKSSYAELSRTLRAILSDLSGGNP